LLPGDPVLLDLPTWMFTRDASDGGTTVAAVERLETAGLIPSHFGSFALRIAVTNYEIVRACRAATIGPVAATMDDCETVSVAAAPLKQLGHSFDRVVCPGRVGKKKWASRASTAVAKPPRSRARRFSCGPATHSTGLAV